MKNLASLAGVINGRSLAFLLERSQGLVNGGTPGTVHDVPNLNSNGPLASGPSGSSLKVDNGFICQDPPKSMAQCETVLAYGMTQKCIPSSDVGAGNFKFPSIPHPSNVLLSMDRLPSKLVAAETTVGRNSLNNIDLNNVYNDIHDCVENHRDPCPPVASEVGYLDRPSWLQCDPLKSSPPQTSRNSDSTSTCSLPSSSGEAQVYS